MWIDVKDKEAIFPSMSKVILITDGQRHQIVTVEKFLETVDAPYNTWTHWMEIPKIENELISEDELDKFAEQYADNAPMTGESDYYGESCFDYTDIKEAYKAGCKMILEKLNK